MLSKFILSFISERVLTLRNLLNQQTFTVGQGTKTSGSWSFHLGCPKPIKAVWTPKAVPPANDRHINISDLWLRGSFIKTISYTRVKKKKAILINIITTLKLDFLSKNKNSTRTTMWLLKWMHKLLRADLSIK